MLEVSAAALGGVLGYKGLQVTGLLPAFGAGFSTGAASAARSHDPFSWERATEKNRST